VAVSNAITHNEAQSWSLCPKPNSNGEAVSASTQHLKLWQAGGAWPPQGSLCSKQNKNKRPVLTF
jgi:hypothetical protein